MNKITNSKLQIPNKLQIQMFKITNWIPASAGMTINIIVLNFEVLLVIPASHCHSRESGNLLFWISGFESRKKNLRFFTGQV
jgi:hypothetical protein